MTVPVVRFYRSSLVSKENYVRLKKYWKGIRQHILGNVETYTGLRWKANRIKVHVRTKRRDGILGLIDPSEPHDIELYATSDNRMDVPAMVHELVHSNVWGNYINDLRWKDMALFEDVFADELLTEIIAQEVCIRTNVGGRKHIDYSWAIRYGFVTTFQRVSEIIGLKLPERFEVKWKVDKRTQSRGMKSFREETKNLLIGWSRDYFREIKKGHITAVEGRRDVVELIPSLSDYLSEELFFR